MILVPMDAPGLTIVRNIPFMNLFEIEGHCELHFKDVRVPASNLLAEEGSGFALAQARLGPGRIHHCMRFIGQCELAIELMTERALGRIAFGKPLSDRETIREWIALSRMEIEQARLLVLRTAWIIDNHGNKAARNEVSMIKVIRAAHAGKHHEPRHPDVRIGRPSARTRRWPISGPGGARCSWATGRTRCISAASPGRDRARQGNGRPGGALPDTLCRRSRATRRAKVERHVQLAEQSSDALRGALWRPGVRCFTERVKGVDAILRAAGGGQAGRRGAGRRRASGHLCPVRPGGGFGGRRPDSARCRPG